jgi:xanthine/uracil/vitamin C permease (AzgA family)
MSCKEGKPASTIAIAIATKRLTWHVDTRRDLVTATAAVSGMSTFMFGLLTNLPVAIA